MAGKVTEVFKWDLNPITIRSVDVGARALIRVDEKPVSVLSGSVESRSLHVFAGRTASAAENARAIAGARRRIATDRDPFRLRRSAPAVFHLLRIGREFHHALKAKAPTANERVHAALAAFGKPFDTKAARTHALKFVDPHFRFGRGDPSRLPFDAATLSDPAFIFQYRREEWIGDGLALLVASTHWHGEQYLANNASLGQGSIRSNEGLVVALKRYGFGGKEELCALVKIITWNGPRRRRKTPSEKKPQPYRKPAFPG